MRGGAIPLLSWAGLLALLMAGNWVWTGDAIQVGTFAFAVVAIAGSALALAARRRSALRRGPPGENADPEAVPDLSTGAVLCALALATIVFGLAFGHFLLYFGGGLLALALGRLVVELRAERRTLERSRSRREAGP